MNKMNKMTGSCTPEIFWEEVAHFGWGTKTTDCDAIEREMLGRYDDVFLKSFLEVYDKFVGMLYKRVTAWEDANGESCGCGDDGFGDLLSHVVGLGKEEYEGAMEAPRVVVERGQVSDYEENFSYSFPYPANAPEETLEEAEEKIREGLRDDESLSEDAILRQALERTLGDQAKKDPRLYGAWSREQLVGLAALMDGEFGVEFGADLPFVVGAFTEVAKNEPKLILERGVEKVVGALERIEEKRKEILARERRRLETVDGLSYYWGCRNMVTDIQKYLGDGE